MAWHLPDPLPHSFLELQTERSYLLNSLDAENLRAADLLRRIPPLEATLVGDGSLYQKRKTRKQLGWLKHRLEEISRQEQTILQRLGQLAWEINQKERWRLLEERRMRDQQILGGELGLRNWVQHMYLNAAVPEFQHRNQSWQAPGVQWGQIQWKQQNHQKDYFGYGWETSAPPYPSELTSRNHSRVENEGISPKESIPNCNTQVGGGTTRRPELWHRSSSLSSADLDLTAKDESYVAVPRVKRNSLPILPGSGEHLGSD